jgi:TolB protein
VFESIRGGYNHDIYVMNADGTNQTRLTNSPGTDFVTAWSPDGTRLAFVTTRAAPNPTTCISSPNCNAEIYTINADGSNPTRLTNDPSFDGSPDRSPDGSRIVFERNAVGIYVMNADGSNVTQLPSAGFDPTWSPDGTRIAFVSSRDGTPEIYVMNSDSSNQTRLTNNSRNDSYPTFSPDGTRIAFISNRDDISNFETYVMNADGSNTVRITNSAGYDGDPHWQTLPQAIANPIDDPEFFVRQHYRDFLNREPDTAGLNFWMNQITSCGSDQQCIEIRRINVSAAFFLSIEFQETGYLVYRFYNTALNRSNQNQPRLQEFLDDTRTIGQGVVIGQTGWEQVLENNKQAFAEAYSNRAEVVALYPTTLTPSEYVGALYAHAGVTPSAAERQAAIDEFNNPTGARGRALRRVAENRQLFDREFNRAFVLIQYLGYLRRNPNDAPDANYDGYNFWLGKLNQFGGNFVAAEMVKAFISSSEYRRRFGTP